MNAQQAAGNGCLFAFQNFNFCNFIWLFQPQPRLKQNENMARTDSQDYSADEILYTSRTVLFNKTTRFASEITTLFKLPPQLFSLGQRVSRPLLSWGHTLQKATKSFNLDSAVERVLFNAET
jgi:hypothetical protein